MPTITAIFRSRRRRRCRQSWRNTAVDVLEPRCLLAITGLAAEIETTRDDAFSTVEIQWTDSEHTLPAKYDVWLDQIVSERASNSKVYFASELLQTDERLTHSIAQPLEPGEYRVWVCRQTGLQKSAWVSHQFEVDNDGDSATPIALPIPDRPEITVIREGQGAAGQIISEGGIGWLGNSALYDVWLGKRAAAGNRSEYAQIRNVPQRSMTLNELALAARQSGRPHFSDIHSQDAFAQLETGDYELFVRGINGASDADGRWIGRGPWSSGLSFSFHRIEGSDAVPDNIRVTNEVRPTIEWDPVPHAESYLVSFWKGPDYSNHRPLSFRVYGTKFTTGSGTITAGKLTESISPGDEFFVRVRAIGSEGMLEGFRAGNYAFATISVPDTLSAAQLGRPVIGGPARLSADAMPVLRWEHSRHAATYDIWFTSLQTRRRILLVTGITENVLHLNDAVFARHADPPADGQYEFLAGTGLMDGEYRFWVRAQNPAASAGGEWSQSHDFTVDSSQISTLELFDSSVPETTPLVSPNLIEEYQNGDQKYLLVTNGLGESFGASVLARYALDDNGLPVRPVVTEPVDGTSRLQFPDLSVGKNVADMSFLDDNRLVVLSRGSNDLRIIDLATWEVISEYDLKPGAGGRAPDAMDMEILDNGQILVVFNRSNRLRVIDVDTTGQLFEVQVPGSTVSDQGFVLPAGRAMQVSAVAAGDHAFTVFLATPQIPGVVSMTYDSDARELRRATDATGIIPQVRRSEFSAPFVAGRVLSISSDSGSEATFYLSTDRNGFLTWINVKTFRFGFVDLIPFVDGATRDRKSEDFRDPDDNHVDPTRIIDLGSNNIAILNNRSPSVSLSLSLGADDRLTIDGSSTLSEAYGGAVVSSSSGSRLYTTAGIHTIVVTELYYESLRQVWTGGEQDVVVVAEPVDRATVANSNSILLEVVGRRRSLVSSSDNGIVESVFRIEDVNDEQTRFREGGGPTGSYYDSTSGRLYTAVHSYVLNADSAEKDHFLIIVDITDQTRPVQHAAYSVEADLRWYSVEMTAARLVILDRLNATTVTVSDWQTPNTATTSIVNFGQRHPGTYGRIRSGRLRTLADGTDVVLHDTTPDKVFSVFKPGDLLSGTPVATVHTNTVGQWIFDVHVFDQDRVIAVTWDAKVLILNVRTGVFETIHQLDDLAGPDLDLFGVRDTSFHNGILSVSSPAAGIVAEFRVDQFTIGTGHNVTLTRIIDAPDVVNTLLTDSGQWVVEANRIRHFRR